MVKQNKDFAFYIYFKLQRYQNYFLIFIKYQLPQHSPMSIFIISIVMIALFNHINKYGLIIFLFCIRKVKIMAEEIKSQAIKQSTIETFVIANPQNLDKNIKENTTNEHLDSTNGNNYINNNQNELLLDDNHQIQKNIISQIQSQSLKYKNFHSKTQQKQADEQQYSRHQYSQLSMKLQSALNKIQNTKKKKLNKSSNLNQSIIVRFQQIEQKKKRDIIKKKQQNQMTKVKQLKQKPTIDKKSAKISKELGHKPIYLRVQKLVEEKKRKLQENQELKKKKQEQQVQKYLEQLNKFMKKPQNIRSYDQYFNEMVRWKQKKIEENKQKHEINMDKQLQGITFKPTLNKKSQKMIASQQRIPIQQRPLKKKKYIQESIDLIKQQKGWNNSKI